MNQIGQALRCKTRPIAVILTLLVPLFWSASIHAAEKTYAEYLHSSVEEMSRGDLSTAKANLEAAIQLEPENSSGWYEMGVLYGQINDFRNAEAAFRKALRLQPESAKTHYMLGLTLIANPQNKLDWPGAIAEFRAALKIQPDYTESLNYLGVGLTALGQVDLAIVELEHAIRLDPLQPAEHFNLAIALENNGQLDEAIREYRNATAAKGGYPDANSALGKLLFRMGQTSEAERELRSALRLNPDLQDAHYALGQVLNSYRKSAESKVEFDEAMDLGKREPNAIESSQLSNLALQTAAKGDMEAAEALLKKAIWLRPDYGVPHYNLGLIQADRGNLDGAVEELTLAISLMPGQAKPWFDLGRVQLLQKRSDAAFLSVSWAARLAPTDPLIQAEFRLLKTERHEKLTTTDSTIPISQPKIGAVNNTAEEHFAFAKELIDRGNALGAAGELLHSLVMRPGAVDVRGALAVCYERLGETDRAVLEYHKILFVAPDDVDTYLAFGRISMARGLASEAENQFRRALGYRPDSVAAKIGLEEAARLVEKH